MKCASALAKAFLLAAVAFYLPKATAQTLTITNGVHTYVALTNTTVTMTGRCELRVTATNNPIPGCLINLDSPNAWFLMLNVKPSAAAASYLGQVRVNGANAVSGSNVRVVEYGMGTVVIPHAPSYQPLQVFSGAHFSGTSNFLSQYTAYADGGLGVMNNNISSFKLKRGYLATFAQNGNGSGLSRSFVAQDGDLDVAVMPPGLDNTVSFVRVFPWRWTAKKGIAGNIPGNLNVRWYYNWSIDQNSSLDWEYVPIRQNRWWPDLNQNWQTRGATHLLGYNEPDKSDQANLAVGDAIAAWPDLLATGLRVGSPATSDSGRSGWLYPFLAQADAAGLRVDFVAVHYYWCYDPSNPSGAASQMYNFLLDTYNHVQRPLWVTEWNNNANWTGCADPTYAQQQACVAAMMDMLENTPFVERYALYNWVENVRAVETNGVLTPAGVTYRDRASRIGYVQDGLPGGVRPRARFRFEHDVLDSSGFGNHGLAVGIPAYTPGRFGNAIRLDGTNSYVQLPTNIAHSAGFSFAAWVFWEGGGNWQRIFDFGNDDTRYLFLTPSSGSGSLRFAISTNSHHSQHIVQTPAALPVGQWRHVAVTLGNQVARLYLNGVLVAASNNVTINPSQLNPKRNYLGRSQYAADPLFRGRLDEVILADYALTAAEIAALQTNQPPQFPDTGDGFWTANADGNWSDPAMWNGGVPAHGPGHTADFTTLDITANRTVTLDSSRSIGTLRFGDASGTQSWTLTSSGGSVLTLDAASGDLPAIVVNQNTTVLAVSLAGTNGFTKSGPGPVVLSTSNSLSGALNLDRGLDGNNDDGATRLAHPDAVRHISSLNIRNTSVSTAGGATLQLDGSAGNLVLDQLIRVTCRNNSTRPTIQNLSGTNTLRGFIALNVGGNQFNLQSDAGLLVLSGTNQYIGALTAGRTYAFSGAGDHLVSGPILHSTNGAPIGLSKSGPGTLTLAGVNTYTNTTTVSGGLLVVNGTNGRSPVTVSSGATLGGCGVIGGPVTVQAGGTLVPGATPAAVGTLTLSNSLTLQSGSVTRMKISKAPMMNDVLRVAGSLHCGGTLVVTNLGGALAAGDHFKLFSTGSLTGGFAAFLLPGLTPDLVWNTSRLTADGTLWVVRRHPPRITGALVQGLHLIIVGSEATPGWPCWLVTSTNVDVPLAQWSCLATNLAGADGQFTFSAAINPGATRQFFAIRIP